MANSKIDAQMERMKFLMEFKNTPKVDTKAGIEYHINAADGKTYGIIRENNMYYIKTTTPENALVKESYDYIGGFNNRNEHGYKSYNEATKHLELELMHINESTGKHEDVSITFDSKKGQKDMQTLTEAARTELDRMHQIFENSGKIGHYNNPFKDAESKGSASAENTEKNNAPFEEKAEATLDKDIKADGTVKGATPDNDEVKGVDADLQSDKMKDANSGSEKDLKDVKSDLEGDSVADQHPSGAKAVMVNEGIEMSDFQEEVPVEGGEDLAGFDTTEVPGEGEVGQDINLDMFNAEEPVSDEFDEEQPSELDELLKEFMDNNISASVDTGDIDASIPAGLEECEVLDGPKVSGDNSVHGEETMDRIEEDAENHEAEGAGEKESKIVGPDEVMDGPHGELDAQTWDKLQESIDRITNAVCERLAPKHEVTLAEAVDKIVKEEVTKLDAWGKHPRYQKPAFKTPANKEVAPNGAKDWNDDSAKGEKPYGTEIGSSAPFDKTVDMLTDAVLKQIKESYGLKKK